MKQNKPKTSSVVSICGLFAALSVVIMLLAHIGVLTYAVPAVAGALLILIYLELGVKNAFTVYLTVSVLSFLICEKEAALCYILFFGYYPILKAYIEKIPKKALQWLIKIAVFTVSFALVMVLCVFIFGIPIDEMGYGVRYLLALAVGLEVMFAVYDMALTRVITLYFVKYQESFRKLMRINKK